MVLVAGDLARPAAIEQLQILGKQVGVTVLTFPGEKSPENVAKLAREEITRLRAEVAIFDAAGRLDVDDSLLAELEAVGKAWEPQESLLVADAATGQTAVKVAQAFKSRVPLTGLVLSKVRCGYARRRGAFLPAGDQGADPVPGHGRGD